MSHLLQQGGVAAVACGEKLVASASFFDAAKQPGIPNRFSVGVGLHGSKQKLTLPREAAWELGLRAESARGCLDGE